VQIRVTVLGFGIKLRLGIGLWLGLGLGLALELGSALKLGLGLVEIVDFRNDLWNSGPESFLNPYVTARCST